MLAGHDQSGGEVIEKDGRKRKLFYGMSSSTAMKKHKVWYQGKTMYLFVMIIDTRYSNSISKFLQSREV